MEMKKQIALCAAIFVVGAMLCSCSNDEPTVTPPTPDLPTDSIDSECIPLIEEAPSKYVKDEYLVVDTLKLFGLAGMYPNFTPRISICEEKDGVVTFTRKYDSEIYFERQGVEYRLGDKWPGTYFDAPIAHSYQPTGHRKESCESICLGAFNYRMDETFVMHWPSKNLKIYFRMYSFQTCIDLKDGQTIDPLQNLRNPNAANIFKYGLYANGEGVGTCLNIRVYEDGTVKLFRSSNAGLIRH